VFDPQKPHRKRCDPKITSDVIHFFFGENEFFFFWRFGGCGVHQLRCGIRGSVAGVGRVIVLGN
jgi:hypothetical protein